MPKFGWKVPHLRWDSHTSFKVKRSKVEVTRPINGDTHRASYLPNGKAYEFQTSYTDGKRRFASATGAMTSNVKGQGHKVMWSVWAQWPVNRKRIVVVSPTLAGGYPMTRATLRTSFKVKRSKVRVTGRITQTYKMCHIFRTVRPKNFKVGVRMENVDPHQRQAPWVPGSKVKVLSSHRLYVSSLPLLNSGNKMLYLCH